MSHGALTPFIYNHQKSEICPTKCKLNYHGKFLVCCCALLVDAILLYFVQSPLQCVLARFSDYTEISIRERHLLTVC